MSTTQKKLGPGDDVEMIESPDLWPNWPVLPVKRRKSDRGLPDCGCVLAVEGYTTTVLEVNMFLLAGSLDRCMNDPEMKKRVYDSAAAMVADGWVVD